MTQELPERIGQQVEKLRARGGSHAALVERLLAKRAAADGDDERRAVDAAILALGRPSRVGIGLGALAVVVLGAVIAHTVQGFRYEAAVREGERRVAKVLRLDDANCWFGSKNHDCIELSLQVTPASGPSFDARITYDLHRRWSSRVQPGSLVYVSLDRSDGRTVRLDEAAFAEPPPAQAQP